MKLSLRLIKSLDFFEDLSEYSYNCLPSYCYLRLYVLASLSVAAREGYI